MTVRRAALVLTVLGAIVAACGPLSMGGTPPAHEGLRRRLGYTPPDHHCH